MESTTRLGNEGNSFSRKFEREPAVLPDAMRTGILLFWTQLGGSLAVLDVSPTTAEDIIDNLRSHIFVDSRHLSPSNKAHGCDSLSGPNCNPGSLLGATGVIPSEFTGGFTIEFDVLHRSVPLHLWKFNYTSIMSDNFALPSPSSLVLKDLPDGGRITSRYSMTLPSGGGLARLDGRWLLEDTVSMETLLPAYISFSEPVMVQQLWAELTGPPELAGKSNAVVIVAFRLGTETVWTTEAIVDHGYTMDITSRGIDGHGPLRACDQIVIFSTVKGLKIVSIEFQHVEEQVLVPTLLLVPSREGSLMFKTERVDAKAISTKQIVSIKEAIQRGLQLNLPSRKPANASNALAELVAKDIGMIVPIDQVLSAIKDGQIQVPRELRKAILKNEKSLGRVAELMTKRALQAIISDNTADETSKVAKSKPEPSDVKELLTISDLFIAALMHQ